MNPGIENIRKRGSRIVAEGAHMLPAASLMIAEGVINSLDDLKKPFVTVINSYTNQIPGHAHLDKIGAIVRDELKALGFNVWYGNVGGAVCDGIAMGHFGMKYSLASRELIADQIETIIGAHPCDAWIGIANCDKIVPGDVQRHGAHQYSRRLSERRADAGRRGQHGPDHRVRSRWQAQRRQNERRRVARAGRNRLPRLRKLRRNVHREFHELPG